MTKRTTTTAVVAGLVAAVALLAAGCGSSERRGRHDDRRRTRPRRGDQGRADHRPRPAQRQRLQRARLQRAQAGRARARRQGAGRRVEVGRRLRPEHDDARAAGLRPDHRRRVRAGRRDRDGGEEVPEHEVRDRRRRPGDAEGQAGERPRAPVPRAAGRLPRRLPRRARGEARRRATGSAPSAASRSRRSTATSRATRPARQAAVPGIVVKWGYSQDWDDQAKCKELALNQIAAGSKVVFQVAGGCGLGALLAAKQQKVWGIGVDADQSFLGPHVLTSALKGVDSAVFLTAKAVQDGTFTGRRQRDLRARPGRRRARHVQPEREQGGHRGDEEDRAADRRRHDHRTSRPRWVRREPCGARGRPGVHRADAPSRAYRSRPTRSAPSGRAAGARRPAPSSRRRRPSRTPRPRWRRSRARGSGRAPAESNASRSTVR